MTAGALRLTNPDRLDPFGIPEVVIYAMGLVLPPEVVITIQVKAPATVRMETFVAFVSKSYFIYWFKIKL